MKENKELHVTVRLPACLRVALRYGCLKLPRQQYCGVAGKAGAGGGVWHRALAWRDACTKRPKACSAHSHLLQALVLLTEDVSAFRVNVVLWQSGACLIHTVIGSLEWRRYSPGMALYSSSLQTRRAWKRSQMLCMPPAISPCLFVDIFAHACAIHARLSALQSLPASHQRRLRIRPGTRRMRRRWWSTSTPATWWSSGAAAAREASGQGPRTIVRCPSPATFSS